MLSRELNALLGDSFWGSIHDENFYLKYPTYSPPHISPLEHDYFEPEHASGGIYEDEQVCLLNGSTKAIAHLAVGDRIRNRFGHSVRVKSIQPAISELYEISTWENTNVNVLVGAKQLITMAAKQWVAEPIVLLGSDPIQTQVDIEYYGIKTARIIEPNGMERIIKKPSIGYARGVCYGPGVEHMHNQGVTTTQEQKAKSLAWEKVFANSLIKPGRDDPASLADPALLVQDYASFDSEARDLVRYRAIPWTKDGDRAELTRIRENVKELSFDVTSSMCVVKAGNLSNWMVTPKYSVGRVIKIEVEGGEIALANGLVFPNSLP